jgi:hypothetical protein
MTETIVYDFGPATAVLRPCTEATAQRAGQLVAALRDAAVDGLPQEHEELSWHGRVRSCIANGFAAEVVVKTPEGTTGSPFAVVLALPDNMHPGKALLIACEVMSDREDVYRPALLQAARDWAAGKGLELGRRVRVVREDWVVV